MNNQRPLAYLEACKPSLLENIVNGKFWFVSDDFRNGRLFDPPELQAKKAAVILQELAREISEFPDPETLPDTHGGEGSRVDTYAKIMLLRLNAGMRFDESITKKQEPDVKPQPQPQPQAQTFEPAVPLPVRPVEDVEKQALSELHQSFDARFSERAIAERVRVIEREAAKLRAMRDQTT